MQAKLRIGAAALVAFAAALLFSRAAAAGNEWGADYFPNVPLVTQDGKVVRFYDDLLKGKAVAINLMYTHCSGSCPLETARMVQVQKLLGDRVGRDVFFYSITIQPERDPPKVLKAYAERFHAKPGWLFLTGKMDDIKLIARKLGLSSLTDAGNKDGHQPTLMVGNEATGEWMRNSAVDNPQFLAITMMNFLDGFKNAKPLAKSYADVHLKDAAKGEYLFKSRCSACHTIGKGDGVGPDLAGLPARRERAWVGRYISEPDKMLEEKDPVATALFAKYQNVRMPNLNLEPDEVAVLVSLIEKAGAVSSQSGSVAAAAR
jgi:protein SCO1/2